MLLHQEQVALRLLAADGVARHRVAVVAVHAAQFDFHIVEIQNAVADLNFGDAHLLLDHFIRRAEHDRVLVRVLGIPKVRVFERKVRLRARRAFEQSALGVIQLRRHVRQPDKVHLHADIRMGKVIAHRRLYKVIADVRQRSADEVHVTENTAHAQLVLIFQVRAVTPLYNQHRHGVFTLVQ